LYYRFNLSHRDIDEVFIKINGKQHHLWRAVNQDGEVVGVYLQAKRDGSSSGSSSVYCEAMAASQERSLPTNCVVMESHIVS
jgi:hypothetical protein